MFTAFSGSHQDAIKKGMANLGSGHWEVPYLPIDPSDVGSSYKETVRVNSQSGKGGVGFVLEHHFGIVLPRAMLVEFSSLVQILTESLKREVTPDEIRESLLKEYVVDSGPYRLVDYDLQRGDQESQRCEAKIEVSENTVSISGEGSGPIEAFVNGMVETLNEPLNIVDYHEHALKSGNDSVGKDAAAICLLAIDSGSERCYGVGLSQNTITASLQAIISAVNRRRKQR